MRAIHDNCRALMCGQHQRAGLELMESMAGLQEVAYERLCRWVRRRAAGLAEADALEVDPGLARAVAALRDRPVLLAYCMDEVAHARHAGLFQRFIKVAGVGGARKRGWFMHVQAQRARVSPPGQTVWRRGRSGMHICR